MERAELERQVAALEAGRGAVALDGYVVVRVDGSDARAWLQDLVTASVDGLAPEGATRTLLLGPTGRIRADLHVLRRDDGYLLLQPPDQPAAIDDLLSPYVLSSDVTLRRVATADAVGVPAAPAWRFARADDPVLEHMDAAAVEAWRIRHGIARFPVDIDEDSLPAEAGLDDGVVIDRTKGCFLGQESVAKVRNLGHPTRIVLRLRARGRVVPGDGVLADASEVGAVTSVEGPTAGSAVLARVRWDSRLAHLTTSRGVPLVR